MEPIHLSFTPTPQKPFIFFSSEIPRGELVFIRFPKKKDEKRTKKTAKGKKGGAK